MKWIVPLLLIPTFALAAKVPVDIFDQSKLETLLRNIPAAFVKTETHTGHERKHYQFPTNKDSEFLIKCYADYFNSAPVPSFKACDVEVTASVFAGEEILVKITDSETVNALNAAISYGSDIKKVYSTERVSGQAADGTYKKLFRYSFICKKDSCDVVFVTKESDL